MISLKKYNQSFKLLSYNSDKDTYTIEDRDWRTDDYLFVENLELLEFWIDTELDGDTELTIIRSDELEWYDGNDWYFIY